MTSMIDIYIALKSAVERIVFLENRQQYLVEALIDKNLIAADEKKGFVKNEPERSDRDTTEKPGQKAHNR